MHKYQWIENKLKVFTNNRDLCLSNNDKRSKKQSTLRAAQTPTEDRQDQQNTMTKTSTTGIHKL